MKTSQLLKGCFSRAVNKPFLDDFRHTWRVQKLINNMPETLASQGIRPLGALDFRNRKTSDQMFILGSGASVNTISSAQWDVVLKHDSAGFNFWPVHPVTPTYYFFEPPSHEERYKFLMALLAREKERYAMVPLICEYKHWSAAKKEFQDVPGDLKKNLYLHAPYYIRTRSQRSLAATLYMWRLLLGLNSSSDHKMRWIIHHRATLSSIVMFSLLAGYKEIILLGIDLNSSNYFWEDQRLYEEGCGPPDYQRGVLHGTVDPARTASEQAIPIDEYIFLLNRIMLKPFGVKLYIGTERSRLSSTIPAYTWGI